MDQQQRPRGFMEQALIGLGIISFVARVLAMSVEPILHRRMGKHALGMPAMFATLAIPFWGAFFPGDDLRYLLWFWLVFLAGCISNRVFPAPPGEHTRYGGVPRLWFLFRRADELSMKAKVEPALVMLAGVVFLSASEALGTYLLAAGFGLAIDIAITEAVHRAKVDQLNDARLEQERFAMDFRAMRGE